MGTYESAAFQALNDHRLWEAQDILRQAVKETPGQRSFQNLGVFYGKEGQQLRSGRGRRAGHLARHWLEKALACGSTKGAHWMLGYLALSERQPEAALAQFQAAFSLEPEDWSSAYHCALACSRSGADREMLYWSQKLPALAQPDEREDSADLLAYALFLSSGRWETPELRELLAEGSDLSIWARFTLSVLLKRPDAAALAIRAWKAYALGMTEKVLLLQALLPDQPALAWEYAGLWKEQLLESPYPSAKREAAQVEHFLQSASARAALLQDWRPQLPVMMEDCYLD